ncbi:MAG: hypothetical protein ABSD44_02210 [Terracidiphilus sp.]
MSDPKQPGLSENLLGAIAYITVVPAIFFLAIAPYNRSAYVRFHAWQSTILTVVMFLISTAVSFVPALHSFRVPFALLGLSLLVWILWALIALWCSISALNGKRRQMPLIGAWANWQSNR